MTSLARWTPPIIPAGHEWWTDNPHRLGARLRDDQARGRIAVVGRVELAPGLHGALVRRLKPRPSPVYRRTAIAGGVAAVLALVVTAVVAAVRALWEARTALAAALVCLVLALLFLRVATGHRPTCAGLHCPGCKG